MSGFEIVLSTLAIAAAGAGMFCVGLIVRASGRDRPSDPARVAAMVRATPLHNSDRVMMKQFSE